MIAFGLYRHYKGGVYNVVGVAKDTNADELIVKCDDHGQTVMGERWVVVYVPQDVHPDDPMMYVRTVENFTETLPDGRPRFEKLT